MYVCTYIHIYIHTCIYIYIHMYVCVYIYIYTCIYVYIYTCMCVYIYIYIYTHYRYCSISASHDQISWVLGVVYSLLDLRVSGMEAVLLDEQRDMGKVLECLLFVSLA